MAETIHAKAHITAEQSNIDLIQLHANVCNALQRCIREMSRVDPSYEAASRHCAEASKALQALSSGTAGTSH